MNLNLIEIGIGALVIIVGFVILFLTSFVSASPGEIKVISGPRGQRVIHGKTGWKIPILERVDNMTAEMISIDVKTSDYVPTNDFINVKVVAAVKVRIGTEKPELFKAATRNFLYKTTDVMADEVRDTLEGHLRAIIGQMELKKIIQDRVTFSEKVQENATKNLEEMGLEIVAFNVQSVVDEKGVIENLGIDNTEKIRKDAAKAKAVAYQEVAEQEAKSQKIANDARVEADLEIAKKNNELEIKIAELKVNAEITRAKADASYAIEEENQRKEIERQRAEANIIKQEKEAEVKEREVRVKEQTLNAEIKKQAEAEKYQREQQAQAERIEREQKAQAEKYEALQEAEAIKAKAEAGRFAAEQEAEAIKVKGVAEAETVRLKLNAEAEGLEKKAEAMLKMKDAAVVEMLVKVLPDVAKAVAEPLKNVDSITMYGEGNSGKMVGDIMTSLDKVTNGLGIDVRDLIKATLTGKAIGGSIQPTIEVESSLKQPVNTEKKSKNNKKKNTEK
jgi:band 7 protein